MAVSPRGEAISSEGQSCSKAQADVVIVRLVGGLGNQLFQYSLGRRLSAARKVGLKLDTSDFERSGDREFRLQHFAIEAQIATPIDVQRFQRPKSALWRFLDRLREGCKPYYRRRTVWQRGDGYDERILRVPRSVYLVGYWQSEKYFTAIRETLLDDLTVVTKPAPENIDLAARIGGCQSVSLHVRRGDYVTHPGVRSVLNTCSEQYYLSAVRVLGSTVSSPTFFVFSDDIAWAKDHLKLDYPTTFVAHNGPERDYEDFRLMAHCRHHIIANSTFSWWAAWLSSHPDKIVVAPQQWFRDPTRSSQDLIPSDWMRL